MAIVTRILSLLVLCSFASQGQSIQCRAGEEIIRENETLASLTIEGPCRVVVRRAAFKGNRAKAPQSQALPPSERRFADHYQSNGLLIIGSTEVVIENSTFTEIAAFAILASGVKKIRISHCK